MTEPNEVSEAWRDHREAQRVRRAARLPGRTAEIYALIEVGHSVKKFSEYQFRIDGLLDLYPTHQRYHVLNSGDRGNYKSATQIAQKMLRKKANGAWGKNA